MTTTNHAIRIDRAAYWARHPWLARCGSCDWSGRYDSQDAAQKAGAEHREGVGE